jgi:two-component system sensor histidine kinase DegS
MSNGGLAFSELNEAYAALEQEVQRTRSEVNEVQLLIRQSRGETETLTRRDTQMTNRLRQIEANLENYSRDEIREIYNAVRESQLRLFLMRSQIEQLEHKQVTLEHYAQGIQKIMALLQSLDAPTAQTQAMTPSAALLTAQQTILRIIDAQEKERQLLARQMHDGPATSLSNLVLQAEVVERTFAMSPEQGRAELDQLKTAVNTTFQRTRDFIFNLRPMMLDDLGVFPTLRRYVEEFQNRTNINAQLTIMGKDRRLPPYIEVILFRIIQELIANVEHHARANRVKLNLDVGDATVSAVVEDDGTGFDVQQVINDARTKKALGIGSILERVEMLGGEIRFESALGRGTRVTLRLPAVE